MQPNPSVNTIDVPDVNTCLAAIIDSGGTVLVPKMTLPGIGYLAYFKDPQGNIFGIITSDATAK